MTERRLLSPETATTDMSVGVTAPSTLENCAARIRAGRSGRGQRRVDVRKDEKILIESRAFQN